MFRYGIKWFGLGVSFLLQNTGVLRLPQWKAGQDADRNLESEEVSKANCLSLCTPAAEALRAEDRGDEQCHGSDAGCSKYTRLPVASATICPPKEAVPFDDSGAASPIVPLFDVFANWIDNPEAGFCNVGASINRIATCLRLLQVLRELLQGLSCGKFSPLTSCFLHEQGPGQAETQPEPPENFSKTCGSWAFNPKSRQLQHPSKPKPPNPPDPETLEALKPKPPSFEP
ncbi:unnamed protein product [Symbiodinium sp. CCMP2456]|nr:unnamed protein product [Symbiodinium sp. CCMP2456]